MSQRNARQGLLTADELMTHPKKDALHELVHGVLRVMTPAGGRHGEIGITIAVLLATHVRPRGLGAVFNADTGFRLSRDPDTVRAPDVAFLRASRIPAGGIPEGYIEGAPDLAVEIVSPWDTVYEVDEKVAAYLGAGGRQVWVVNPRLEQVTVHAPDAPMRVLGEADHLGGGDLLPGFDVEVCEIFR